MSSGKLKLSQFRKKKEPSNSFEIPKNDIDPQRLSNFSSSLAEILQKTDAILSKYPEQNHNTNETDD